MSSKIKGPFAQKVSENGKKTHFQTRPKNDLNHSVSHPSDKELHVKLDKNEEISENFQNMKLMSPK